MLVSLVPLDVPLTPLVTLSMLVSLASLVALSRLITPLDLSPFIASVLKWQIMTFASVVLYSLTLVDPSWTVHY